MKEKIGLVIGVFLIILFLLLIITYSLSRKKIIPKNSLQTPTISSKQNLNNLQINNKNFNQLPQTSISFEKISTIASSDSKKLTEVIKKLPLETENFRAYYLPLTNQVVFVAKNQQGYQEISNFLKENGLEELSVKNPQLIKITNNDNLALYQNQEEAILEEKDKDLKKLPSFNLSPTPQSPENLNNLLVDFLRIFFEFSQSANQISQTNENENNNSSLIQPTPAPTIFDPNNYLPQPPTTSYNSLQNLFNEVGSKVGVPPKILEAVLTIETPSTFNFTAEQINLYSAPGNIIPNCGPNVCSATGPMQMTTGVDKYGSSSCSSCCGQRSCLNSCPNAWATYGKAVNIFANQSHQPNPCNLRDNIYAAAYKLKTDSGATDPLNWTQEQVFRAGLRYYGRCDDAHRYQRLGNRTYCEFLWWYYKRN